MTSKFNTAPEDPAPPIERQLWYPEFTPGREVLHRYNLAREFARGDGRPPGLPQEVWDTYCDTETRPTSTPLAQWVDHITTMKKPRVHPYLKGETE